MPTCAHEEHPDEREVGDEVDRRHVRALGDGQTTREGHAVVDDMPAPRETEEA